MGVIPKLTVTCVVDVLTTSAYIVSNVTLSYNCTITSLVFKSCVIDEDVDIVELKEEEDDIVISSIKTTLSSRTTIWNHVSTWMYKVHQMKYKTTQETD